MLNEQKNLQEWINQGRRNGTIRSVMTVVWAYRLEETRAIKWIASIVRGEVSEADARLSLTPFSSAV